MMIVLCRICSRSKFRGLRRSSCNWPLAVLSIWHLKQHTACCRSV